MKNYVVFFSFETGFGRGNLSILRSADSEKEAEVQADWHLRSTITFRDADVVIEGVREATPEDLLDFKEDM